MSLWLRLQHIQDTKFSLPSHICQDTRLLEHNRLSYTGSNIHINKHSIKVSKYINNIFLVPLKEINWKGPSRILTRKIINE